MADRELLAAAQLACDREVWDRCINTSERTKAEFDFDQRFPMPFRESVVRRSREIGLDPAYVYGLIRQESRFIMDARSHVGASGLMQVMPATARWTARKIGLAGFTRGPAQRPRHQHRHRHRLPEAGAGRLRRLDAAGRRRLQRRPRPAAQLAQRPGDRGRGLGRERAVQRNPRLREEGAGQHHHLRRHPDAASRSRSRPGWAWSGPRDASRPEPNRDLP